MQTVRIEASVPYDVRIGDGALDRLGEWAREALGNCRAAIVTDSTVDALYGAAAEASLRAAGMAPVRYAFPAGERNKRLSTLEGILEFLAENQITRADAVVALGGGVPGDVAGFAAAVYARGIRFVQAPTTLLAAVDSSVGGKTAVDLRAGKNLAGSFHQPSLVVTDTAVMRALPSALLADGAAEIIKYGVLADAELFARMRGSDWTDDLGAIIARSVAIKRDFVRQSSAASPARAGCSTSGTRSVTPSRSVPALRSRTGRALPSAWRSPPARRASGRCAPRSSMPTAIAACRPAVPIPSMCSRAPRARTRSAPATASR